MNMSAYSETQALQHRAEQRGISLDFAQANVLRRAQKTLHRWAELECGHSDDYRSWCISRDEDTDLPYMEVHPHTGKTHRYRVPDRERGALKRIAKVCAERGLHFYHQGDPRGCALYIAPEPLKDHDYSHGLAVY
jgi:hypothetical protein